MSRKNYVPTPVEELTEEELKRGFQRLRELYEGEQHHVHEVKVERGQLRVEVEKLKKETRILNRDLRLIREENERLKTKIDKLTKKVDKTKENKEKSEPINDFKKKFFDSL